MSVLEMSRTAVQHCVSMYEINTVVPDNPAE